MTDVTLQILVRVQSEVGAEGSQKWVRGLQPDHTSRLWPEQGWGESEGVLSHMRLPPGVDGVIWLEPNQVLHHHPPVGGQGDRYHMELDVRPWVPNVLTLSPDKGQPIAACVGERAFASGKRGPRGGIEDGKGVQREASRDGH